jgi:hypothetical protein
MDVKHSGLSNLFSIPLTETFWNVVGVSNLGIELSVLQVKYHWDLNAYFQHEWFEDKNPLWGKLGRSINFGFGLHALLNLPGVLTAFFKSGLFTEALAKIGLSAPEAAIPTILGFGTALTVLAVLGVPLTPLVVGLTLAGSILGGAIGIGISAAIDLGSGGAALITNGVIIMGMSGIVGGFFGWIGSLFDKAAGNLISGLHIMVGGIQALFELFMIMRNGLSITNVLNLIMAITSIVATLNYLQTMTGTNTCTIDQTECNNPNATSTTSSYLAYYEVTVISSDSSEHSANIQKIISILNSDPTILEKNFPGKQKYIFIGNTNDAYVTDQVAVIAISKDRLYATNTSPMALISNSAIK